MQNKKINHTGLNELELYTQIANTCEAINKGALKEVSVTIRAVPVKDFFRALKYFNVGFRTLRCTETNEILGYCFHVTPKEFPGLIVTVASELVRNVEPVLRNINWQ